MEITQYLIVSPGQKKWGNIKAKTKLVSSLKGNIPANAVAIKLNIVLPDTIFNKPQLQATIKVREEDISKPVINAETLDNIKVALSQNLGVDMTIQVVNKEDNKKKK